MQEEAIQAPAMFKRQVLAWFDYKLTWTTKDALLRAWPKVIEVMSATRPWFKSAEAPPKRKEGVVERLAELFVTTLGDEVKARILDGSELPKHYQQTELNFFLDEVQRAAAATNHVQAFTR